jgi:hypothetical protein
MADREIDVVRGHTSPAQLLGLAAPLREEIVAGQVSEP